MERFARDTTALARQTFELYAAAKEMMRQNLRRRFPEADDSEIQNRLRSWLLRSDHEPGSISGPFRVRSLPEGL